MSKKVALYGVLIALAFIFSYIEALLPINVSIPGIKVGLANIVIVMALYLLDIKDAMMISVIRIVLVGLTFGNMSTMIYSIAGGLLSLAIMTIAKKSAAFSIVGVSVLGATFHNIGQILVAIWMLESKVLMNYLPILLISGVVAGVLIGIMGGEVTKRLEGIRYL